MCVTVLEVKILSLDEFQTNPSLQNFVVKFHCHSCFVQTINRRTSSNNKRINASPIQLTFLVYCYTFSLKELSTENSMVK